MVWVITKKSKNGSGVARRESVDREAWCQLSNQLRQNLALSMPLWAEPLCSWWCEDQRWRRGCRPVGERKPSGKVGAMLCGRRAIGNLKGRRESSVRGRNSSLSLGKICRVLWACIVHVFQSRWGKTVLPQLRLVSGLSPGHQYAKAVQQQPPGAGAYSEPKSQGS